MGSGTNNGVRPQCCSLTPLLGSDPVGEFMGAGGNLCQKASGTGSINKCRVIKVTLVDDIEGHDELASCKLFNLDAIPEAGAQLVQVEVVHPRPIQLKDVVTAEHMPQTFFLIPNLVDSAGLLGLGEISS